jgi:hypothetical protein
MRRLAVSIINFGLAQCLLAAVSIGSASAAIAVATPTTSAATIEPVATNVVVTSQVTAAAGVRGPPEWRNLLRLVAVQAGRARCDATMGWEVTRAGDRIYAEHHPQRAARHGSTAVSVAFAAAPTRRFIATISVADTAPPIHVGPPGDGLDDYAVSQVAY